MKPDIVFFGESLPDKFAMIYEKDLKGADAVIVMGTSLQVLLCIHRVSMHVFDL